MCKLDLKDTYLCVSLSQDDRQSDVSMGRNSVQVSMPVLWPCTSPICFHKTPKDSHGHFKKDRDTNSNLSGHANYWQNKEEPIVLRNSRSFTSVAGNCYKLEKVSGDTIREW